MRASFLHYLPSLLKSLFYPRPDLLEPHILRSLSNIKITSIHASCCGCHFICLDVDGAAWMFGRSSFSALGEPGEDAISENTPRRVLATDLGADEGVGFVHAVCGRSHTLLVGSDGRVWSAGANNLGQVSCVFGL
jgi:alpha-tubulin suppressor-like RCC1 family protein